MIEGRRRQKGKGTRFLWSALHGWLPINFSPAFLNRNLPIVVRLETSSNPAQVTRTRQLYDHKQHLLSSIKKKNFRDNSTALATKKKIWTNGFWKLEKQVLQACLSSTLSYPINLLVSPRNSLQPLVIPYNPLKRPITLRILLYSPCNPFVTLRKPL